MKEIDRIAIEDLGIIGPILMENAGLQIAMEIMDSFPDINYEEIVIVA
jgi:NAD(P)H-hydrate repair Nnr-like enzyme with NAD(P)H-hydrate epimerase domain